MNIMTDNEQKDSKTSWHHLLAKLLEELLSPVGISVHPDLSIMTKPPKADILLLRNDSKNWTEEQRLRLPDGIRHSQASHIILEFKYTESVNRAAVRQILGYDIFYKRIKQLSDKEVQSFLLSAVKPQSETLAEINYQESTKYKGVYHNHQDWTLETIPLISLNELSDEPHNAWVKCFASHKKEKEKAFKMLGDSGFKFMTLPLKWFLAGLWEYWFSLEEDEMSLELTPEQISEMGKMWGNVYLSGLGVEERLAGLSLKEVLPHFKLTDVVKHFSPAKVVEQFSPAERLAGLPPDERLAGLPPEVIEEYLSKQNKS
jgi:hypothetical protein